MNPKLSDADIQRAATALEGPESRIRAVCAVESRGSGFDSKDQPIILFERHKFFKYLAEEQGVANAEAVFHDHPEICNRAAGGYSTGSSSDIRNQKEHGRLAAASAISRTAALKSASWGLFQVMGFNWDVVGYPSLQSFINAAYASEGGHLDMFVGYVQSRPDILAAFQKGDYSTFAKLYNGKDFQINRYDSKLKNAGF